ncbi:MAG: hypothetical protein EPO06_00535 [Burkholderiaceae bacterium]|nr:MAG: hypothetical protein EPO06_00535 [Burkholderiaceae bacterium]
MRRFSWIAGWLLPCLFGLCGAVWPIVSTAQAAPTPDAPAADRVLSRDDYLKLCGIEPQLNFFQRMCQLRQAPNAQAIKDDWLVFTLRNRDALREVSQACHNSRRWPALQAKLREDERMATGQWLKKPQEEVNTFCDKMPASLRAPALEETLARVTSVLKNSAAPPKP